MIVYNRRKRAIYFQEQEQVQAQILQTARDAVAFGTASPAQIALVEGIAEEEELMAKKTQERGVGSRIIARLRGEWKEEEELTQQRKLAVEDARRELAAEQAQKMGVTAAVQQARAGASTQHVGGPLDQAAENAVSKGWFGWLMKGDKKDK